MSDLKINKIVKLQGKISVLQTEVHQLKEEVLLSLYDKAKDPLTKANLTVHCETMWVTSDHGTGYRCYDVCVVREDEDSYNFYKMDSENVLMDTEDCSEFKLDSFLPEDMKEKEKKVIQQFLKTFYTFCTDGDCDEYELPVEVRDGEY